MTLARRGILAALGASALVAAFGSTLLERLWARFGPPDLGPVAFETLQRRTVPNDALACPAALCRAASDLTPPLFAVSAGELRLAFARMIAAEPDVTRVKSGGLDERYIQRTRWLRFPDTVVVRYIPRGDGQSTLALYSRSQLGQGDWGVNRARIKRWLDGLAREAPVVK
jgi:uncharacterized protein (DUF1499 family)